ncbi:hypothetical protein [Streptomyces sp. NPDC085466]|uniref:hypothetical protein n=1 Tax=Streptomyces sp. NPDC085466 TaxID=3365725 RepID=UPI0037D2A209
MFNSRRAVLTGGVCESGHGGFGGHTERGGDELGTTAILNASDTYTGGRCVRTPVSEHLGEYYAELRDVLGRCFDDGLDLRVGQGQVRQRFRVDCDAEKRCPSERFPYTAVRGALFGCDEAASIQSESDFLVIGLLFSRHEDHDEITSILTLGGGAR